MKARIIGPLATDEAGTRPIRDQVRIVSDGSEFDCRLSVVEIVAQRGNEPPLHRHQHEDLLICILAGQLTIQLDGQRLPAAPGSCVLLPRGSEHGYAIESETARLLLILMPAGAERCLAELHGSAGAASRDAGEGASAAIERLVATAARYGVEITGPPLEGETP